MNLAGVLRANKKEQGKGLRNFIKVYCELSLPMQTEIRVKIKNRLFTKHLI
jgi:hypothetical protein